MTDHTSTLDAAREVMIDAKNMLGGDDLHFLIGEFMNLVNACRMKGVQFEQADGCDLNGYTETINGSLYLLGHDEEAIAQFWTGERQLTSS